MISIKNRVGRPIKKDKEAKINEHVMLSQETDAKLREYANMHGIPISRVIEKSIIEYVEGPQSDKRLDIEEKILDLRVKILELEKELNIVNKGGKYD